MPLHDAPCMWPQEGCRCVDHVRRERVAKLIEKRHPRVAAKIRAGMRSSNWPEDLIDPGYLLDILEQDAEKPAVPDAEKPAAPDLSRPVTYTVEIGTTLVWNVVETSRFPVRKTVSRWSRKEDAEAEAMRRNSNPVNILATVTRAADFLISKGHRDTGSFSAPQVVDLLCEFATGIKFERDKR